MFPRPSACPNRFFVKFSTTYLTDIAFGQLLSLLVLPSSPLFFRRTRQRGRNRDREIGRVEKSKRKGRNFGETDGRERGRAKEGGREQSALKRKVSASRAFLTGCVHHRICVHVRTHAATCRARIHPAPSLFLSLSLSSFDEQQQFEAGRKKRNRICANFLVEPRSRKRWVFAKRSKGFTSIVVKLTPRAGACCVLPTLSTTFSHDTARIRGFHLRSLCLSPSPSLSYSTKRISTVNRPNKGVA